LLDGESEVKVRASRDIDNTNDRTLIIAATAAANMDPRRFPNPEEIVITKDSAIRDERAYLHLGGSFARHECLGKFLVPIEATECMRGLLLLGNLTVKEPLKNADEVYPTDPLKGRAYPHSFVLSFDKGRAP
jgi:cytochrome P450